MTSQSKMFKSLKQKIAKETGQNVDDLSFHSNNNINAMNSQNENLSNIEDVCVKLT